MLLALLLVAFAPFLSAPTGWAALHAPSFDASSDNRADERTVLRNAALAAPARAEQNKATGGPDGQGLPAAAQDRRAGPAGPLHAVVPRQPVRDFRTGPPRARGPPASR